MGQTKEASARRLAINTALPIGSRVLDLAFALVYLRFLREEGTGAYQFLVVFTTYLDTVIDFGLNTLLARDVARHPSLAGAAARRVNLIRLALWALGLVPVVVVFGPAREAAGLPETATLAGGLFYLALLPSILAKTATGLLWAFERLDLSAGVSVLATVLKTAFGVVALVLGAGVVGLGASSLAVNVVSALLLVVLAARVYRPAARTAQAQAALPDVIHVRSALRASWPLFVNQMLQGLFFKVDSLLLPGLAGTAQAGAYAAAYKVNEGVGTISSSATLALFPRLARDARESELSAGHARLANAYRISLRALEQVAWPLTVGIALLAEPIVTLVGGREFLPDAAIALTILIWYLPFSYCNGLTQYVLIAVGRQRFLTGAFLLAFVLNAAANVLLIPRYGFLAAAWVTVASEIILLVPFRWAASRVVPGVSLLRESWHAMLATALMAPIVWWLRDAIHPLAAAGAGLVVYPLALWALGGIGADQTAILLSLLPARARARFRPLPP